MLLRRLAPSAVLTAAVAALFTGSLAAQQVVAVPPLYPSYRAPIPTVAPPRADTLGLTLRLTAGDRRGPERTAPAPSTQLARAAADALLARVRPIETRAARDSFAFPAQTFAAPRSGRTLLVAFPPVDSAPPAQAGPVRSPLVVTRYAPEGEVPLGAEVTVTFSKPIIPLSSVGAVDAMPVPVRMTPTPAGRWRWLDVRTARFEPQGRLPMATEFTVEVLPQTRAADGTVLAEPVRWSFATPAPRVTGGWPADGPVKLDPVMVAAFDGRVDPAAVLRTIRVRARGRELALRLATEAEVRADADAWARVQGLEDGRWVAFRAVQPLPRAATLTVDVGPGTPSAEGSRRTADIQRWGFRTFDPFRIESHNCGWRGECRPGMALVVHLNNVLEESDRNDDLVQVLPAIEGMQVRASGTTVVVFGKTLPNTDYTVRLGAALRDVYGQTLGPTAPQRFHVGPPVAGLSSPYSGPVVLDPLGAHRLSFFSHDHARLRVRIHRVAPGDWGARLQRADDGGPAVLPGRMVVDRIVRVSAPVGQSRELPVDLEPALDGGLGQVVVAVEAVEGSTKYEREQGAYVWVQSTRIALVTAAEPDSLTVWATSLVDGSPLGGVELSLEPGGVRGTTGASGLATLRLPPNEQRVQPLLVARRGGDVAILSPQMPNVGYAHWLATPRYEGTAWYNFTDRNLYKPGETVRFKGWLRRMPAAEGTLVSLAGYSGDSVTFVAKDARGNEIWKGATRLSALDGFDGSFVIPAGANLGMGYVSVTVNGRRPVTTNVYYQIQEFRRPEYEVGVTADPGPHFVGGSAEVVAKASYFAGGGLPGAAVEWRVVASPGSFTPPGWEAWSFGPNRPWWMWWRGQTDQVTQAAFQGETDASGSHALRVHFDAARPPRPYSVTANATITDVNRQSWSTATSLLVHPASVYLGLRSNRAWFESGDTLALDLVAVDLDGRAVEGRPLAVVARRSVWRLEDSRWEKAVVDSVACARVSAATPVGCTFPALQPGEWTVTASSTDDRGRPALSEMVLWVTGPGARFPARDEGNGVRTVDLVPDRDSYAPGDTARVMLRLPFAPARGVLSLRRNGVVHTEPFRSDENTYVVRVPLSDADLPNVHVQVDVVGGTDGGAGDLPTARGVDVAVGTADLKLTLASRTLVVRPVPADSASSPDAENAVEVEVRDAAGRPVPNAEIALVGVDEAVLALTGYQLGDPLQTFYPEHGPGASDVRLHPMVRRVIPDLRPAPGTLVGQVLNAETGEPVGGARVSLVNDTTVAIADANGRFRLRGVRSGARVLRAELAGFQLATMTVQVGDSAVAPLRVYLIPEASPEEMADQATVGFALEARASGVRLRGANSAEAPPPPAPPPPPPPPPPPGQAPAPRIEIRTNFDPLAFWLPAGRTDAAGRLRTTFTLPSNLTRYRVSAVAVEGGTRYGLGESAITARKPLMARPSAPRFLNFGDRFELSVVVQNGTGRAIPVQVAARGDGVRFTEPGRSVTVPAYDRVEVRIPAEAVLAGPATIQAVVSGGGYADAAEVTLPVYTPATAEAFAVYGQLTEGAAVLPLDVPEDALPGFGGLEVTASSTALQELTDSFLYLMRYPFDCSEQKASRIVAVAALRDVLRELHAEGLPPAEEIDASMRRDVAELAAMQNPDGGWDFWTTPRRRSWPYVSIHVAHALVRASEAGFAPPPRTWEAALRYLRAVPHNVPADYSPEARRMLHAFALYTRDRGGDRVTGEIGAFLSQNPAASLGLEEAGWLLAAIADEPSMAAQRTALLRLINNRATETASTATFATHYTEGEYLLLHSDRRTDAVVLEGLLTADPSNELVTKTVRGLLGHRVRGRWESTQENGWVLLALNRYFRAYEAQTPDFVARVWLGERYAGGAEFRGRSADRAEIRVPMGALQAMDPPSLTIGHEGTGRLYYRAGLRYAPRDLDLTPLQRGFAVERTYEALDDTADVRRGADGIWRVRAGARVRVTVTMTAPSRRVHVALVDPMPAGWEPVNPALRGNEPEPATPAGRGVAAESLRGGWWRMWWFEHQNLRDDRAEAFASYLPAGVYTYSYTARATTPGLYIVPPPRAEEMYSPETFGRGGTERVIVQ